METHAGIFSGGGLDYKKNSVYKLAKTRSIIPRHESKT